MKLLFTIFLILTGLIFAQELPKYAPGQAIIIIDQNAYSQIQNDLLQKSIQTSNPDASATYRSSLTRLIESKRSCII